MASAPDPSFVQIAALPRFLERPVPAEYEDANGHMNISGYLLLHNEASWPFMASVGIDDHYLTEQRMSIFDVEHHLKYLGELGTADEIAIHGTVVERNEKLLHGMFFLVDLVTERLSNTFEFVSAHVSLASRTSVPFPDHVAEALDAMVAAYRELGWQVPLSGTMGLRRR